MADREQQQQQGAQTATKTNAAAAPAPKGVRALNHQLSLSNGHPKVAAVVQVMDRYPDDRDAMMEVLHRQLGNGFVQEVVAAIQRSHTARGSQPAIAATADHDEHAAPAPTPTKAPPAPPANANAAAPTPALAPTPAPAPTTTAAPAAPAEQYGFWAKAGDAAVLLAELAKLELSLGLHPFSGKGSGDFDLSAAMRIAHVFAGDKFNVTLGALPKGTNRVHVELDAYNGTFDLSAATLQVGGVTTQAFTAGGCVMSGVTAHYDRRANGGSVAFAHARFQNVTFIRDKERVGAADMEMQDLHVTDPGSAAGLSFGNAHVHGLVYPNMPPIDFDMPGGASFAAVWAHESPTAPKPPAGKDGPLPEVPDVLPQGSRIAVKLVGLKAAGSATANEVDGTGGFEQLRAAIVQDGGKELASVEIDGFQAAGSAVGKADTAGASIRQIAITGDPKLVDTLLKNPQVSGQPSVKAALDLVRSVGLDPAISGHLVAHNITAKHGPAGNTARGDFNGDFDVPQLGLLSVQLTGMTASTGVDVASQISTQFDKCALTLKDHGGKEIAFLELDGGAAKIDGAKRHGQVKQLAARGNVAQLVTAGDAIVKHAPVDVRGALQAVRALGITGNVTGSLAVDTDGKHTTFSGDFDASIDAGHTGSVALHVGGLRGTDGGDVSFDTFTASMKDAAGHQAATIDVEGGESGEAKKGNEAATKAKKISAKGEDATVNAMIGAIQAKATTLPAPIKASFAMVRRFYANAGGSITMTDAAMGQDKAGAEVARTSNIDASFDLHGAGKANVALTGFKAALGAKSDSVSFTLFDAQLIDTAGHKAAHMRVEGSHDSFATVGKNDDFSLSAKSVHIDGDSKQTSALLAGIREHISTLPQPIAASFKLIERYTGEVAASGTIAASDVALDSKAGKLTGHGTIEGHVRVPEGTLDAKLTNSRSDGDQLGFDALDVSVRDPHGAVAATLHATGAKADAAARTASLDDVAVHGDATKLRGVLDPTIQRMMPPQVGRVLAMIDQSQLSVEATGVTVSPTRADVKTINATGTIEVNDVGGKTYTARNAQLELDGTDVVMDAAGKPKELAVTGMSIRGNWASVGGGDALRGDATVRTGAARIELDANGAPKHVHVASVFASGDASRTASAAAPAPAVHPTKAQQIASLDSETQTAEAIAQQVQTADIRATVPLVAGRYGRGLAHVNVPAGATVSIAVEVQNNTLTNATSVHIAPPLDIPAGSVKGVDLETKGRDGIFEAQVGGFSGFLARLFGKANLNGMAVGKGPMSLDLPTLVRQVTDHMRQSIVDSKDEAPDPKAAQKDAQWMQKEQASWQKDHSKHVQQGASQKTLDKDAMEQPRSANIGDFATSGIDLARANASADIVLARTRDGVVSGHLHGAANGGGRMQLSADSLNANLDGNQVQAAGVNTGVVNVQTKGNTTEVQLGGLRIDQLDWQRK